MSAVPSAIRQSQGKSVAGEIICFSFWESSGFIENPLPHSWRCRRDRYDRRMAALLVLRPLKSSKHQDNTKAFIAFIAFSLVVLWIKMHTRDSIYVTHFAQDNSWHDARSLLCNVDNCIVHIQTHTHLLKRTRLQLVSTIQNNIDPIPPYKPPVAVLLRATTLTSLGMIGAEHISARVCTHSLTASALPLHIFFPSLGLLVGCWWCSLLSSACASGSAMPSQSKIST